MAFVFNPTIDAPTGKTFKYDYILTISFQSNGYQRQQTFMGIFTYTYDGFKIFKSKILDSLLLKIFEDTDKHAHYFGSKDVEISTVSVILFEATQL